MIDFEGLKLECSLRLIENTRWLEWPVLSRNNHKELLSSPVGSKTKKPIRTGLCVHIFLTEMM